MSTFRMLQEFYYTQGCENDLELVNNTLSLSNKRIKGKDFDEAEKSSHFLALREKCLPVVQETKSKSKHISPIPPRKEV